MEFIGDLFNGLEKYQRKVSERKVFIETGPNSPRAEQIEKLVKFMGETNARFKYWTGRTRKLSPEEIYLMMKKAGEGKNPQALFNYLLKQSGKK